MITERDKQVILYLQQFGIATTSTLQELYYPSLRVTQNRLKTLTQHKEIKRMRNNINQEYLYYIRKPKQLKHKLLLTNLHRKLHKIVDIVYFKDEFCIEHIRCDALIAYKHANKNYISFVEVQISNKPLDIEKYIMLLNSHAYKKYFPVFPQLIAVTNQKISSVEEFKIIKIGENLSNINDILK